MKFANRIFGEKLKQFLAEAHIKQKDLADTLDVATPTVSQWVTGEFMPEDEKFAIICEKLKKDPGEFFGQDARPDLAYASRVLAKLGTLEPRHLRVVMALIYKDHSLSRELPKSLGATFQALLKAL